MIPPMSPIRNGPCPCGSGKKYKECCLLNNDRLPNSSQSSPTPGQPPDYLMYVGPQLMMRVDREAGKIADGFDSMCRESVEHLNEMYLRALSVIYTADARARDSGNDLDQSCASVLSNALKSLTAALALLRPGWRLQPHLCLRNALEAMSVAIHLHQKPADLPRLKEGDFETPMTITSAKVWFPGLGRIYGLMSNQFVHIGSPFFCIQKGNVYEELEWEMWQSLAAISFLARLIYVTAERVFYDSTIEQHWWCRQGPAEYTIQPSVEMRRWMSEFRRLHAFRAGSLFEAESQEAE